jgi:hypothetical protein
VDEILEFSESYGITCDAILRVRSKDAMYGSSSDCVVHFKLRAVPQPYVQLLRRWKIEQLLWCAMTGVRDLQEETLVRRLTRASTAVCQVYAAFPTLSTTSDLALERQVTSLNSSVDYRVLTRALAERQQLLSLLSESSFERITDYEFGMDEQLIRSLAVELSESGTFKRQYLLTYESRWSMSALASSVVALAFQRNLQPLKGVIVNPCFVSQPLFESFRALLPVITMSPFDTSATCTHVNDMLSQHAHLFRPRQHQQASETISSSASSPLHPPSMSPPLSSASSSHSIGSLHCHINYSRHFGGPLAAAQLQSKLRKRTEFTLTWSDSDRAHWEDDEFYYSERVCCGAIASTVRHLLLSKEALQNFHQHHHSRKRLNVDEFVALVERAINANELQSTMVFSLSQDCSPVAATSTVVVAAATITPETEQC